ncbi:MAG: hypothetical protein KME10_05450 [Plectolyngbya sp. WJT66-NPBG17]|nr:hypothetical protein [Plectolyngbya sp. WJT66-NPBG17]
MTYEQLKTLKPSAFKRRCGYILKPLTRGSKCCAPTLTEQRSGQAKLSSTIWERP